MSTSAGSGSVALSERLTDVSSAVVAATAAATGGWLTAVTVMFTVPEADTAPCGSCAWYVKESEPEKFAAGV